VPTLCESVLVFELSDPLQPTQIAEVRVRQMVTAIHVVEITDFIVMGQRNGHFGVLDLSEDAPEIRLQAEFEGLEKGKVNYLCSGDRPREVMMGTFRGLVIVEFSKDYDKVRK